ncbi:DUF2188 domain-containing protein [uncultured Methanobrevibacter sp.]|uniref:DUF2188 domain-containing protein n=1 Tax=uncultured Methanobrevibacter sp. TaxID=253161 RepID=UPI0025CF99C5|nr:DUF2188 domain-containing protein [uncultured Methanobrevibacter sp.]
MHVVPNDKGTWSNKKSHAKRASSVHQTQTEAISSAQDQAKRQGNTEVIIHGRDGKIREPILTTERTILKKTKG